MAKCPKCGLDFLDKVRKCPNCQTIMSQKKADLIEMPKLKNDEEIEVLDIKEIKVKQIPVKVKKIEAHYDAPVEKEKKCFVFDRFKVASTIKMVIACLLLAINGYLIYMIVVNVDNANPVLLANFKESLVNEISEDVSLSGQWITQNGGLFVFQDNEDFYWYDSYQIIDDNYYGGLYSYKQGIDALVDMGFDEQEFYREFGEEIDLSNVYSLSLRPVFSYKNRRDNSVNDLNDGEVWWFLMIIDKDNVAYGYNKTLDLKYNMKKANS